MERTKKGQGSEGYTQLAKNPERGCKEEDCKVIFYSIKMGGKKMAQWLHILGVVRYDYWAQNIWSSETRGKPKSYDPDGKIEMLNQLYKKDLPYPERYFQVQINNSNSGPIVTISGDLRFVGQEGLHTIQRWLNSIDAAVNQYNENEVWYEWLVIRDAVVLLDIENSTPVMLTYEKENGFVIVEQGR